MRVDAQRDGTTSAPARHRSSRAHVTDFRLLWRSYFPRYTLFAHGFSSTTFRQIPIMTELASLAKTPLHDLHQSLGAKMVAFAGYEMPLQYRAGILTEHLHTRSAASLFDVSHMGQAFLGGANPAAALERLTPADVLGLRDGQMRYG